MLDTTSHDPKLQLLDRLDPDALLRPDDAAQLIGLTSRFLEARRLRGGGPPYIRISSRAIRYRRRDLLSWAQSLLRTSTSDPGPRPAA